MKRKDILFRPKGNDTVAVIDLLSYWAIILSFIMTSYFRWQEGPPVSFCIVAKLNLSEPRFEKELLTNNCFVLTYLNSFSWGTLNFMISEIIL